MRERRSQVPSERHPEANQSPTNPSPNETTRRAHLLQPTPTKKSRNYIPWNNVTHDWRPFLPPPSCIIIMGRREFRKIPTSKDPTALNVKQDRRKCTLAASNSPTGPRATGKEGFSRGSAPVRGRRRFRGAQRRRDAVVATRTRPSARVHRLRTARRNSAGKMSLERREVPNLPKLYRYTSPISSKINYHC